MTIETIRWASIPPILAIVSYEFLTPIFLVAVSKVTGIEALLLAVENANRAVALIFLRNTIGLNPVNTLRIIG